MVEFKTRITKIIDYPAPENGNTRVFECTLPKEVDFPYVPGQFAMVSHEEVKLLANPNALKWASYSISSSPHQEGLLEFCIGGGSPTGVTHRLMRAQVGEEIGVRGAFGNFKLVEGAPEYVFLATGTGIAPLVSMVRFLLDKGTKVPMTLYYGFRHPSLYMYREELEQLQGTHPNFKCVPVASRPDEGWTQGKGHVQDVLKEYASENRVSAKVYICGKPAVAEELVAFCRETVKFTPENVIIEKW